MNPGELAAILDSLKVQDETGPIAICFGLSFTVYFFNGHLPEAQKAVVKCLKHYLDLCAHEIHWGRLPNQKRFVPLGLADAHGLVSLLSPQKEDSHWELTIHGGEHRLSASPFYFEVVVPPAEWNLLTYLKISLPLDWHRHHEGNFPALMLQFCRDLQPMSGYGGISLLEAPNNDLRQSHQAEVNMIASRFPGLDIDYPFYHVIYLDSAIKGVNWLTALNGKLLDKVGGLRHLKRTLNSAFVFHQFSQGVLIQAGTHPQLGDREQGLPVPLYSQLSAALKPIRITEHRPFHFNVPGAMDEHASEAWLARFD